MGKLAFAHPGKIGDALYCLPVMRYLSAQRGMQCDFYTSTYCSPLKRLFEYQSYVDTFSIAPHYRLERMDMGCQPWYVPFDTTYEQSYQLGFQSIPDSALHQFIAKTVQVTEPLAIAYEYPDILRPCPEPYVVIAPRGKTTFELMFNVLTNKLIDMGIGVVAVGGVGDNTLVNPYVIDTTGYDMLDTLAVMSHAQAFVGLMSSQLVLANGFDIPRIAVHDGKSWDMRHVVRYHRNFYLIEPGIEELIAIIKEGK